VGLDARERHAAGMAGPVQPLPGNVPVSSDRPVGVTILAVLAIVAAIFALFAGIAIFAVGSLAAAGTGRVGFAALGVVGGVLVLAYAAFSAAVAWGLWMQRRWAWYATVVLAILQAVFALSSLVTGGFLSGLLQLVLAGVVVWYLMSPPVQGWFHVSYKAPWGYRERAMRPPGSV
jgi:lysylphosphatidylglycerol synthetase-like protein (DUF2156 family)